MGAAYSASSPQIVSRQWSSGQHPTSFWKEVDPVWMLWDFSALLGIHLPSI